MSFRLFLYHGHCVQCSVGMEVKMYRDTDVSLFVYVPFSEVAELHSSFIFYSNLQYHQQYISVSYFSFIFW
jgi:hypothetical protein